jgi:cytochrome c oxidase assembly protein subunit 15
MDAAQGFTLLRELGQAAGGGTLPFEALVAIHMAHRVFAVAVVVLFAALAWRLWREGSVVARRFAGALVLLLVAQLLSGLSNVVLGWPLLAALGHSAGAAGLVLLLALLLARSASPQALIARQGTVAAA